MAEVGNTPSVLERYEDALRRIARGEYYAYRIAQEALAGPLDPELFDEQPITYVEVEEAAREWA